MWMMLTLVGLVILFWVGYSPLFQIKNVEVAGNQLINPETVKSIVTDQLASHRFLLFSQSNIFFFDKHQVAQIIEQEFLIQKVSIKKKYFQTVEVLLGSQPSGIAWVSDSQQYYLDLTGVVNHQANQQNHVTIAASSSTTDIVRSEVAIFGFPVVYDLSNTPVTLGQSATSAEVVSFITTVFNLLSASADFDITRFVIDRPYNQDVIMVTQDGWEVRFKITDDPRVQVNTLITILQQKVSNRKNLQYIDLRFGQRVFYK